MGDESFDVDAFLARPLVAHLATAGPAVRPVWYLWEERAFWILTGSWSHVVEQLARDARPIALAGDDFRFVRFVRFVRLAPEWFVACDLSYRVP